MSTHEPNLLQYADVKTLVPCKVKLYFKCVPEEGYSDEGYCGRNIGVESATLTVVVCPNCGHVWRRGELGWSGQR